MFYAILSRLIASGGKPGLSNTDQILEALIDAGWIIRHDNPTRLRERQFFGVGGFGGGRKRSASTSYPQEFGYKPADGLLSRLKEHGL